MYRYLFILGLITASGVSLSCDSTPKSERASSDERAEGVNSVFAEAREAEADRYAPAYHSRAEEALQVHQNLEEAETLARRATAEALAVRDEAKKAADEHIRQAHILVRVVEAILSHDPPNRFAFPDEDELEALRTVLQRAEAAYESGDYATAGVLAQSVSDALAGASRTTS